jgi:hypothetical protein
MQPTTPPGNLPAEADAIAQAVFKAFNAFPVLGEPGLDQGLQIADLGGFAHEVGTLQMTDGETGVVNSDLKFLEYDNFYACDNSVFLALLVFLASPRQTRVLPWLLSHCALQATLVVDVKCCPEQFVVKVSTCQVLQEGCLRQTILRLLRMRSKAGKRTSAGRRSLSI